MLTYKTQNFNFCELVYVVCSIMLIFHSYLALSISDVAHFADVVAQADVGCDCRTDALVCALLNRLGYVRSKSAVEARVSFIFPSFVCLHKISAKLLSCAYEFNFNLVAYDFLSYTSIHCLCKFYRTQLF